MRKKLSIYSACFALSCMALSGCNDSSSSNDVTPNDMAQHREALFGEMGGEPWSTERTLSPQEMTQNLMLGSRITVGKFDGSQSGVVMSNNQYFTHSIVQYAILSQKGAVSAEGIIKGPVSNDATDSFGYDVLGGNFCPSLGKDKRSGDILLVSAPSSQKESQYGGAVSIFGYKDKKWNEIASLYSKVDALFGGMAMAVGDVNGDAKDDLVYFATDAFADLSGYDYDHFSINVHLDLCGTAAKGELKRDLTALTPSGATMNANVYVKQLNSKGLPEVIVALDKAGKVSSDGGYTGVIYFFKYNGSKLVQSRNPLYGDMDSELTSVAFADLNGDGETDILVGEPLYNPLVDGGESSKFRGRVRAYNNPGADKDFVLNPAIDLLGEKDGMMFGTSLISEDLNSDGYPDLIVGSSGSDTGHARYGSVYVYMGSKDPNMMSKEPFWHMTEDTGSASYVTKMGTSLAVAQLDDAAWPDIVTGAPARKSGSVTDVGGASIFLNHTANCYTAEKCMIDNVCYDKDGSEPKNKCNVCNPEKNNFGWTELVCTEEADECHEPLSACVPTTGCTLTAKADGTACGTGNSCKSNTLTTNVCMNGVCTNSTQSCGNYKCDATQAACPTTCASTSDCKTASNIVCRSSRCAVNHSPTASFTVTPTEVKAGETISLNASASKDPDKGDTLTYHWDMGGLIGTFSTPDSAISEYKIDSAVTAGQYTISLVVKDNFSMSCTTPATAVITVKSGNIDPENHPPVAKILADATSIYYGESAQFDGGQSSDPDEGDVLAYRWYLSEDGIKTQIGTDTTVTVKAPDDPTNMLPEKTVQVSLIVSDGKLLSEEVTVDLTFKPKGIIEVAAPKFVSPVDGSTIESNSFELKGVVEGEGLVTVESSDGVLCTTNVIEGIWDCGTITLEDGGYTLNAVHIENDVKSEVTSVSFTVKAGDTPISVPVITYPQNGDTTGTKPLITGTVDSGEGEIYVWYENGAIDSVLCQATSKEDGTWNCLPFFTLEEGKSYTIRASMIDSNGLPGEMSEAVTFTAMAESLEIESPQDGDILDATSGLIVSGTTSTGEIVNVELTVPSTSEVQDAVVSTCSAVVNADGSWACSMSEGILSSSESFLPNGDYVITAVVVSGNQSYYDIHNITVYNAAVTPDKSGGVRGGSCSMMTNQPANIPWWFAFVGLGLIAIPLRRRS